MTIEKDTELDISLQVQEWNQILNVLADAPFKIAAPLIKKISEQAETSAKRNSDRPVRAAQREQEVHSPATTTEG